MKLSELLTLENQAYEYLLGALYSFKYKSDKDYLIIFASKTQKLTNHLPNIDDFTDQLRRASNFYNFDFLSIFTPLSQMENSVNTRIKNLVGYGIIIKNDIEDHDLDIEILKKIDNKKDKTQFLRGLFDSRSSIDTTARYLSMDMRKQDSKWFAGNVYKMLKDLSEKIKVNINPRFLQPGEKSRDKNPQLRIDIFQYFGLIGTFRINYLQKAYVAKWWPNLKNGTNVPLTFKNIIIWDTSSLDTLVNKNKRPKIDELINDQEYCNFTSKDDKENIHKYFLARDEKNKNNISYKNDTKKRNRLSFEKMKKVIEKSNGKDFFDPELDIVKNKRGEPLLDIHHIIPHRYSYIFNEKSTIDEIDNLIAITQNNHYLLHRGEFSSQKNHMLSEMFSHVNVFLKNNNINISFNEFKSLY